MSDIDSNLPVRAAVGDVVVNILGGATGGAVINPSAEGTQLSVLSGITGLQANGAEMLAGITGIAARLPAVLGQTGSNASMSMAIASDQAPVPVYITAGASNTPVVEFTHGIGVATSAGITGAYAPASAFVMDRVQATASGRIKVEVFAGLIAGWAYDDTRRLWVGFNSSSNPQVDIDCSSYKMAATTTQVMVVVTNLENQAQDLYCTIVGDKV